MKTAIKSLFLVAVAIASLGQCAWADEPTDAERAREVLTTMFMDDDSLLHDATAYELLGDALAECGKLQESEVAYSMANNLRKDPSPVNVSNGRH